ncbi:MAG: hypothetical protein M1839_004990 [Geoglossum umbratile]|nr:MAG: hypothetical protein M1839_004990 [Geoglossum umbratile]
MIRGTPCGQSIVLAPGFIYRDGTFLSLQEQADAQLLSSQYLHGPQERGRGQAYVSPLQLEEVLRCTRLFLSQHAHLTGSRKRGFGEDPPVKTEPDPDSGIQITDGSDWLAATRRRKIMEMPSVGRGTGRLASTPDEERVDSPPQNPKDRRKRAVTRGPSPETDYGWEIKRPRRDLPRPEVHIYTRAQRSPMGDVIRVAVPKVSATKRRSGAARCPEGIRKSRRTTPPETRPTRPYDRGPEGSPSLGELLSEERANRPPAERQGSRREIQDYSRMLSIAAKASQALKKDRESGGPEDDQRSSPCPLQLPRMPLPKASLATPRLPTQGAPPRCQFPLHPYFTESPERVPDPSDFAGDPNQFWLGVHHLAKCASAAHSPIMVGACKVLCKVLCTRHYDQDCVSRNLPI